MSGADGTPGTVDPNPPIGATRGDRLIRLGVVGVLAAAVARTVVALPPSRWFDVDPLISPGAIEGLGPAGGFALDALLLVSSAAILLGRLRSGRGLDAIAVLLAAIPVPVLLWHGLWQDGGDLEQARRGTSLAAAWFVFVAALHLRDRPLDRTLLAAGLLAAAVPWLVRGAEQWFLEHPRMVAHFEAHRAEVLASFGWAEDGEAARLYERRLRQREMFGWFGLSNVWSAAVAACAVAWARLAAATRGRSIESGTIAVAAAIALGGVVGVLANGSKGGIAALFAGLAFAWFAPRMGSPSRLALVAIPIGLLAIVVRGLLPEGLFGERSLLFRWHYLQGAGSTLLENPLGVGPAGVQEAYLLHKPERSPEVVQSAHSMLPDAFLAAGAFAIAWIGLLLRGLWRGTDPPSAEAAASESPDTIRPLPTLLVLLVMLVMVAMAVVVSVLATPAAAASFGVEAIGRWVGIAAIALAGLAAWTILRSVPSAIVSATLSAAAFTLLLQGQIETTFFNQGAMAWALAMVGLAGGVATSGVSTGTPPTRSPRVLRHLLAVLPAVLAAVVLAGPFRSAVEAERSFADAAAPLEEIAQQVERGEAVDPAEVVEARVEATARFDTLVSAGGPAAARAGSLAVEQLVAASQVAPDAASRRELATAAHAAAEDHLTRFGPSPRRLADRLRALRAVRAADPEAVPATRLVEAIVAALRLQPQDVSLHVDWGDASFEAGDVEAARRAWRRALELDQALELDPLVRMPASQRAALEARLAEVE
ncbi:MAG: hypothetical protein ACYTFH_01460 [Planctomycetota bacterium]|jgi:hypothetical protein